MNNLTLKEFPIPLESISVIIVVLSGLTLMKTHLSFGNDHTVYPELSLEGVSLHEKSCNKYIRQILHSQNQLTQRGTVFWNMLIPDIVWKNAWLRPYKYCIPNKVKEVHLTFLHKTYPCNSMISKCLAIDDIYVFCEKEGENLSL